MSLPDEFSGVTTIAQVLSLSAVKYHSVTLEEKSNELSANSVAQAESSSLLREDAVSFSEAARQQQTTARGEEINPNKDSRNTLTEEEEKQVRELSQRDREVRTHEAAHKAVAGQYAKGSPTYEYQSGPDGKNYAVGGEVQIDTSTVRGDPEASLQKANRIQAAATAPPDPSSQDRAVAAQAAVMAANAQAEITESRSNKMSNQGNNNTASNEFSDPKPANYHTGVASYQQIAQRPEQANFENTLHLLA